MNPLWKQTLRKLPRLLIFLPVYLREMTRSNLRVAIDALRPRPSFQPGFVEIRMAGRDPIERWAAACLITMTPGTMVVDVNEDSDLMLVHSLYLDDLDQTRDELEALVNAALGTPNPNPS